jgi:uroporphyrinogen-III synthase
VNILIPKARSEQGRWRSIIDIGDHTLTFVDPWRMTIADETASMRSIWMNLDEYQGVVCVSPTAAQVLIDALDTYWPMTPAEIHWLCNGPRTADVLESHGLTAIFPKTGHTAEDVLQLQQTQVSPGDKWLIVKGDGGRVTYRETFEKRGAIATEVSVYLREVDSHCINDILQKAANVDVIWLSSLFLAEQVLGVNNGFWQQWPGQWWVSSERLLEWAKDKKLSNIRLASGATPQALNNLVRQARTA